MIALPFTFALSAVANEDPHRPNTRAYTRNRDVSVLQSQSFGTVQGGC